MADGDFLQPPQVWRLDGELVLRASLKVVLVAVQTPFSFHRAHETHMARVTLEHRKQSLLHRTPPLPVSPYSPKMLRKTSASVPLPFMSAVNTLTLYLFTATLGRTHFCFNYLLPGGSEMLADFCSGYVWGRPWGSSCPAGP